MAATETPATTEIRSSTSQLSDITYYEGCPKYLPRTGYTF
jgi:hypothetical protein